jgi:hypothetical protein
MDHASSHPPAATTGGYSATVRGIAIASVSLGFFSMIVFWWKPFGGMLASVGFTLGLISLAIGNKGGLRGENYALLGTLICAFNLSVITGVYFALNFVQWGKLPI